MRPSVYLLGQEDMSMLGRGQEVELGKVSQEEFQPEQNPHEIARWIAPRELCQQRKRSAQIRGLVRG